MCLSYKKPAKCVKELHSPEQPHANTHRLFIKLCWLMSTHAVSADRVVNIDDTSCRLLAGASDRGPSCGAKHQGGHDIHGRLQRGPWPAAHTDRASGQDRRRLARGTHSPRHVGERLGHHGDHDPAAHSHIGQRAEPEQTRRSVDPSLGHGQHPRQRGHDDRHEGEVHVVLCFLPPRSAASLHSRDELFAKHIEPEPAPEDCVDWAMEKASDDEDDAPMPDLIDMPPALASARPMSNLEHCIALRLVATRRSHRPKKNKKMPLHHITSSLCCLSCAVCHVSLLSCPLVSCPGTQTVTNLVFFFRWPQKEC